MTTHPHDDIEAFALGSLDQVTARRVLVHADQCPTCAVLLAEAMSIASGLEPADERPLTKDLRFAETAAFHNVFSRPLATQPRWILQLMTAAAVVLLLVWGVDLARNQRAATFTVPVASLVHSHFSHHALHGASGSAKVIQALDGRWLYLLVDGLSPKATYRLFETAPGAQLHEVGTFTTAESGRATGYWEQPPTKVIGLRVVPVPGNSPVLVWP